MVYGGSAGYGGPPASQNSPSGDPGGPHTGPLGPSFWVVELIHELIDFIEKQWLHGDLDTKLYEMEETRLGMGRGDHQLGNRCGAFLAGALFFLRNNTYLPPKKTFWLFWVKNLQI